MQYRKSKRAQDRSHTTNTYYRQNFVTTNLDRQIRSIITKLHITKAWVSGRMQFQERKMDILQHQVLKREPIYYDHDQNCSLNKGNQDFDQRGKPKHLNQRPTNYASDEKDAYIGLLIFQFLRTFDITLIVYFNFPKNQMRQNVLSYKKYRRQIFNSHLGSKRQSVSKFPS